MVEYKNDPSTLPLPGKIIFCILACLDFHNLHQTKLVSKSFKILSEKCLMTGEEEVPALGHFFIAIKNQQNSVVIEENKGSQRNMQVFFNISSNVLKSYRWLIIAALLSKAIFTKPVLAGFIESIGSLTIPLTLTGIGLVPLVWYGFQSYNLKQKSTRKKQILSHQEEKISELKLSILIDRKKPSAQELTHQQNSCASDELLAIPKAHSS